MGNILPTRSTSELTYARPSRIPSYSSQDVLSQVPCLRLKTEKRIKKDDMYLYIDSLKTDISKMTVKEVVRLLEQNNIETYCIEYSQLLDLPALLLNNFCNKEYRQERVKTNPIDLSYYNNIMNKSLTPITSRITALHCINTLTDIKAITTVSNNFLFIKENINEYYSFFYCVSTDDFIWNINYNHLITNSKEYVSKSMETLNENNL